MTQYSYQELREALDRAAQDCNGIHISTGCSPYWTYSELDALQTIINYLPEKLTEGQEWDKKRSYAWAQVMEHPIFFKERRGYGLQAILEAVLENLDELHHDPLPTEYGSVIKNVKVVVPGSGTREYVYMQLTNIGWVGVGKGGVLREAQPEHITSWEPLDSE